jgi:hypothetical protein
MADQAQAPMKYIDLLAMLENAKNKSLAATLLPGQGNIPAPSAEFMASQRNPFPNARPLPTEAMTFDSLAGTLGNMGSNMVVQPGQKAIEDRQKAGFFADVMNKRMGDLK